MLRPDTGTSRRQLLANSAAAGAVAVMMLADEGIAQSAIGDRAIGGPAIRPFQYHAPDDALLDLRRRIAATRWPDRETVRDQAQGVRLAALQPLAGYWGTDYDWRRAEARFNALPQFITEIDGLDIQFAHVRSRHPGALPLIMTHGWPGSVFELLKTVGPLTDPTAHGGKAEDAFHLVMPTYPGYGFSGKPRDTDWGPVRVAAAWHDLMRRLGYSQYVAQGGDWGAIIADVMAAQAPRGLLAIHSNMPGTVPPDVLRLIRDRQPAPAGFTDKEKRAFSGLETFYRTGFGYAEMMNTKPQTLGYALADSPVGLAAFFYDKFATWTHSGGEPERVLTRDEMLDDITLYWLTNTGASSSRSYWDAAQLGGGPFNAREIPVTPVAVTVFPGEIYQAPRSWGERNYRNIIYWNEADRGGHFAAWEVPDIFAAEVRAAFRSFRSSV